MFKQLCIATLFCISTSTLADPLEEFEFEGEITRVGGNGSSILYVRSERGDFQINLPNPELYACCEKYLFMKMEKGYRKVRLINIVDAKIIDNRIDIEFTLGESSFCMLEGPPSAP